MLFGSINELSAEEFRRLTGVKKETFKKMVELLSEARNAKKALGGRPNKLSVENTLLMALEYLREYRTYFHIGKSRGVSEGYAYKLIRWVEDTLIKSGAFALPGKKALLKNDMDYELILIDASESPIQRPKKDKNIFTQVKRRSTL